jgi:hypothetical protein
MLTHLLRPRSPYYGLLVVTASGLWGCFQPKRQVPEQAALPDSGIVEAASEVDASIGRDARV